VFLAKETLRTGEMPNGGSPTGAASSSSSGSARCTHTPICQQTHTQAECTHAMHSRTQSVSAVFCLRLHECAFVLCMWSGRHTLRMKMTTSTAARRDFNAVLGSGYVSVSGCATGSGSGWSSGSGGVVPVPSLLSARVHIMPSKQRLNVC